jgi:hypothetical protein
MVERYCIHPIALKALNEVLFQKFEGRVQTGPFRGMRIENQFAWEDVTNVSTKLIGSYEFELHGVVNQIASRKYDAIVNAGCAEGYYAVGLGRLMPYTPVFAMDKESGCLDVCAANAKLNGLMEMTLVVGKVGAEDLLRCDGDKKLMFVDIEGYELSVLDTERCPELLDHDYVIECHDFFYCGEEGDEPTSIISDELARRFSKTHVVQKIEPDIPYLGDFPFLRTLSIGMGLLAVTEKRPLPTVWLACWRKQGVN